MWACWHTADLLGVSHERASKIAGERGFPAPVGPRTEPVVGSARGRGAGEGLAPRSPGDRAPSSGTFAPLARAIGVITIQ
jgi:hypothetical protein